MKNFSGDRFRSRHLKIEDHAFARRTVLPEAGAVVGTLLIRCLHAHMCFVGLDVTAGDQIALHCVDYRNQKFSHPQHGIVDRGQGHIDVQIAHENRALTKQWERIAIFSDDEVDDGFVREDRLRRNPFRCRGGRNSLRDTSCTGALFALDHANEVHRGLNAQYFGLFVADQTGLGAALAAPALLGWASDDLFNMLQVCVQLLAAWMLLIFPWWLVLADLLLLGLRKWTGGGFCFDLFALHRRLVIEKVQL